MKTPNSPLVQRPEGCSFARKHPREIEKEPLPEGNDSFEKNKHSVEMRLFLYAAQSYTSNDESGQNQVDHDDRDNRQCNCSVLCAQIRMLILTQNTLDHDRHRETLFVGNNDHILCIEVVPVLYECEDRLYCDCRFAHRDRNGEEGAELAASVDTGSLNKVRVVPILPRM